MMPKTATDHSRIAILIWTLAWAGAATAAWGGQPATPPQIGEDGSAASPAWSGQSRRTTPAAGGSGAPHVAIVASAAGDVNDAPFTDPQSKLLATGLFASVTVIHAGLETPTLDDLKAFDAVLVWSNFDFLDAQLLGDRLADYVDAADGGGVVLAVFANTSDISGRFLEGRWRDEKYEVVVPELGNTSGQASLGSILDPNHPLVEGISSFDGGISFRPATAQLDPAGLLVAEWSDGLPLVAYREDLPQRRVDLGFYPPSDDVLSVYWDSGTDGDLLLANALAYATNQIVADVRLQLIALSSPSAVDVSTDPGALPGQLVGGVCPEDFVVELWTSDVGALNTGVTGLYVDLSFDNTLLQAGALQHGALFPLLTEGVIDNPGGQVINFGGSEFTPQGIAPQWVRIGHVEMSTIGPPPSTITASLGLGGLGVFGRPPPPLSQIDLGSASCNEGTPCSEFADCADLDLDGIRDDNCTWWSCGGGSCSATAIGFADVGGPFGACPPDNTTDANDRFHALNCFANTDTGGATPYPCEPNSPMATNADAGGTFGRCCPDGVCDGNDAFHALNTFGGVNLCSCPANFVCPCDNPTDPPGNPVLCPAGPSPVAPAQGPGPAVAAAARITLRPSKSNLRPGEWVAVDLFLDGALPDLRGYQLHVGVSGGRRGDLGLVDIAIENRSEPVFAGLGAWAAFNTHTGQMLSGLDDEGIETQPGAYLATFTFQATKRAAGSFVVDLLRDDLDPAQRTFLFPTPQSSRIEIRSTNPAVITVESRRGR